MSDSKPKVLGYAGGYLLAARAFGDSIDTSLQSNHIAVVFQSCFGQIDDMAVMGEENHLEIFASLDSFGPDTRCKRACGANGPPCFTRGGCHRTDQWGTSFVSKILLASPLASIELTV